MVHSLQNTGQWLLSCVEEPGEIGHGRLVIGGRPAGRLPVEPPLRPPRRHVDGRRLQGELVPVPRPGGCPLRELAAEPGPTSF